MKKEKYFKKFLEMELFDLNLYKSLFEIETDLKTKEILEKLIPIEEKHLLVWKKKINFDELELSFLKRIKIKFFVWMRKILGPIVTLLIIELREIYSLKSYFEFRREYQNDELLDEILKDEFFHEKLAVLESEKRKIKSNLIRNFILGLNDGFVATVGLLSGMSGLSQSGLLIGLIGLLNGIAGGLSMTTSSYFASISEIGMKEIEESKDKLFKKNHQDNLDVPKGRKLFLLNLVVGSSYFLSAFFISLPFLLGINNIIFSYSMGILIILVISFLNAFFTGEDFKKRLFYNFVIIILVMTITYGIGRLMSELGV